jgi:hypothetical protein
MILRPFCIFMSKPRSPSRKPKVAPQEHPRAWGSVLWDHRDEVLAMRRGRKTWKEITEHLAQTHGVKLTYGTVRNFFVRYSKRLKTKNFPVGYGPEPTIADPLPVSQPSPDSQPITTDQPTTEDLSKVAKNKRINPWG